MTKRKRKHRQPAGRSASSEADPDAILVELEARVADIAAADASVAGPLWGQTQKLLLKTATDRGEIARIVVGRDAAALEALITVLRGGEPAGPEPAPAAEPRDRADISAETLKKALRAFRKRLKLTRLDHESRLGVGPFSSGRQADVDAILPPREFPSAVWERLAEQGHLRPTGPGFYELLDG